jgi:hypothetical protein
MRPKLTGTVSIDGTAEVGQTLTADTASLGGDGDISYRWLRGDTAADAKTRIDGATSQSYLITDDDLGKLIRVRVRRAGNSGSVTSYVTEAVVAALGLTWNPNAAMSMIESLQHHEVNITGTPLVGGEP